MALSELLQFLAEAIEVYIQMLSSIEIAGMRVIDIFIFFAILGMVLVIVFRVKPGDLFDDFGRKGR